MAIHKIASFGIVLLLATVACQHKPGSREGIDPVQLMADLHCEAVSLRKARFELADKMRFMEDTLINTTTSDSMKAVLKAELQHLLPYKDSIVTRSLDLGKVIKFKLDSLIEQELTHKAARDEFDARLTTELEKRGCK